MLLDAREAKVIKVSVADSPPQERMLSWLAVEVKLSRRSGCGKLIGKEGEGLSECCVLFFKERASLWLLPQGHVADGRCRSSSWV